MKYTLQVRKSPRGFWDVELNDGVSYIYEVMDPEVNDILGICGFSHQINELGESVFKEIQRVDFTESLEYLNDIVFRNEEIL